MYGDEFSSIEMHGSIGGVRPMVVEAIRALINLYPEYSKKFFALCDTDCVNGSKETGFSYDQENINVFINEYIEDMGYGPGYELGLFSISEKWLKIHAESRGERSSESEPKLESNSFANKFIDFIKYKLALLRVCQSIEKVASNDDFSIENEKKALLLSEDGPGALYTHYNLHAKSSKSAAQKSDMLAELENLAALLEGKSTSVILKINILVQLADGATHCNGGFRMRVSEARSYISVGTFHGLIEKVRNDIFKDFIGKVVRGRNTPHGINMLVHFIKEAGVSLNFGVDYDPYMVWNSYFSIHGVDMASLRDGLNPFNYLLKMLDVIKEGAEQLFGEGHFYAHLVSEDEIKEVITKAVLLEEQKLLDSNKISKLDKYLKGFMPSISPIMLSDDAYYCCEEIVICEGYGQTFSSVCLDINWFYVAKNIVTQMCSENLITGNYDNVYYNLFYILGSYLNNAENIRNHDESFFVNTSRLRAWALHDSLIDQVDDLSHFVGQVDDLSHFVGQYDFFARVHSSVATCLPSLKHIIIPNDTLLVKIQYLSRLFPRCLVIDQNNVIVGFGNFVSSQKLDLSNIDLLGKKLKLDFSVPVLACLSNYYLPAQSLEFIGKGETAVSVTINHEGEKPDEDYLDVLNDAFPSAWIKDKSGIILRLAVVSIGVREVTLSGGGTFDCKAFAALPSMHRLILGGGVYNVDYSVADFDYKGQVVSLKDDAFLANESSVFLNSFISKIGKDGSYEITRAPIAPVYLAISNRYVEIPDIRPRLYLTDSFFKSMCWAEELRIGLATFDHSVVIKTVKRLIIPSWRLGELGSFKKSFPNASVYDEKGVLYRAGLSGLSGLAGGELHFPFHIKEITGNLVEGWSEEVINRVFTIKVNGSVEDNCLDQLSCSFPSCELIIDESDMIICINSEEVHTSLIGARYLASLCNSEYPKVKRLVIPCSEIGSLEHIKKLFPNASIRSTKGLLLWAAPMDVTDAMLVLNGVTYISDTSFDGWTKKDRESIKWVRISWLEVKYHAEEIRKYTEARRDIISFDTHENYHKSMRGLYNETFPNAKVYSDYGKLIVIPLNQGPCLDVSKIGLRKVSSNLRLRYEIKEIIFKYQDIELTKYSFESSPPGLLIRFNGGTDIHESLKGKLKDWIRFMPEGAKIIVGDQMVMAKPEHRDGFSLMLSVSEDIRQISQEVLSLGGNRFLSFESISNLDIMLQNLALGTNKLRYALIPSYLPNSAVADSNGSGPLESSFSEGNVSMLPFLSLVVLKPEDALLHYLLVSLPKEKPEFYIGCKFVASNQQIKAIDEKEKLAVTILRFLHHCKDTRRDLVFTDKRERLNIIASLAFLSGFKVVVLISANWGLPFSSIKFGADIACSGEAPLYRQGLFSGIVDSSHSISIDITTASKLDKCIRHALGIGSSQSN